MKGGRLSQPDMYFKRLIVEPNSDDAPPRASSSSGPAGLRVPGPEGIPGGAQAAQAGQLAGPSDPQPPDSGSTERDATPEGERPAWANAHSGTFPRLPGAPERHIVVCTDSSPASIDALEFTFSHLAHRPAPDDRPDHLTCLCVLREPMLTADEVYSGVTVQQLQRQIEKRFIGGLKRLLSGLREEYRIRIRMTIKIAWAEDTRTAIVEIAKMLKPTMIVLGSRGLTGSVAGSFLGSVSGHLLHKCPVPVIVARVSSKEKLREEAIRVQQRLESDLSRAEAILMDDMFPSKGGDDNPRSVSANNSEWMAALEREAAGQPPAGFLRAVEGAPAPPSISRSGSGNLPLPSVLEIPRTGSGPLNGGARLPINRPSFLSRGSSGDLLRTPSGDVVVEDPDPAALAALAVVGNPDSLGVPEPAKRKVVRRSTSFIGSLFGRA